VSERWQTAEPRSAAVFFRDSTGAPVTGLTLTATAAHKDGSTGAPAVTSTEVGNGFYRIGFTTAPAKDVLVLVDGGATLTTTRYAALEVPVGGYVDAVDAPTSSRSSATAVAGVQTDTTALLTRLTAARATLLDLLSRLDATVTSRSSQASVDMVGSPAQAAALANAVTALTSEIGTRARPADVAVTVTTPVRAQVEIS
jgi:hypothetical protein